MFGLQLSCPESDGGDDNSKKLFYFITYDIYFLIFFIITFIFDIYILVI